MLAKAVEMKVKVVRLERLKRHWLVLAGERDIKSMVDMGGLKEDKLFG